MRSLKFFLLFVCLLSVSGWCGCYSSGWLTCSGFISGCEGPQYCSTSYCSGNSIYPCLNQAALKGQEITYNNKPCVVSNASQTSLFCSNIAILANCCDNQCELDSLKGCPDGSVWDSQNCRCNDVCGQMRAQCESSGGSFTGRALTTGGGTCCSAVCDRCNDDANNRIDQLKTKYCCEAGFAPPAESQSCYSPPGISGCGMTTLQRLNNTLDYQCRDPNSSQEASQAYYEKCFPCEGAECSSSSQGGDGSSSSEGGDGSSSSGGGSSASPYPEGCDECPYLDSILDTLKVQKSLVEQMYLCVVYPSMCQGGESEKDSVVINLDSNMLVGVTANQDSLKDLLRSIIDINGHIDTTLLSVYENLGGSSFDTTLRKVVQGGFSSVDTSLGRINGNINSMDANNRNRLDSILGRIPAHVFDSIRKYQGASIDRLDSILGRIPAHVFDSIRKYQGASIDRLDTLLFGRGAGFSMVDSLTDTVRKYLKVSNHYDSLYYHKFVSFDSSLGDRLDNMSITTDFDPLGYGDTATNTLRGDLLDLRGAIASFDSSVSREIDSLLRLFSPGGIDTGAVGYGSGFVAEGERFGDSLARAVGWLGGLDGVNHDSIFRAAGFDSIAVDSVGRVVDDSLNLLADSLNNILVAQNDSIKNNLPSTLDAYSDSLIAYSPFASFDSLIFGQLGAKIPNSNQCPDDCNKWSISLPRFGLFNFTIDYGLCLGRVPLGGMNVLGFIRLLLRIVVVWSCIWIVFNALTRRKD